MRRVLASGILLLSTAALCVSGSDHAVQDAVMRSQLKAYEQQRKATDEAFRRDFELKFNRLVKAAEDFSKAYNEHKGETWPSDKAEALRRAMEELQKQQQFRPSESARGR